ncbi:Cytoplasmic copper homeostasis protein CutC [Mesoplasma florum W37]|uniref:Copper homeostasis protein cutC homolog n=1 Tax=Mesoplasma florum TaxID=2151 RepID=A0AAD0HSK2_MESFO|nr:copper homeostasis protein CutC [Mesoplasma florum]AGY41758.1 Cytoplasmic copper homeostasis protein CutC [Mesoplasma florum W37]AVN59959.1 copper homeostasis protein [Mesoplasma florum]AVN66097.1 Cytoplasmic copper homeostasis protein CutC [Mesoplasma florum]
MILEVIAKNLEDILLINKSNADRIEFCTSLEVGGLTPSYEEIKQAGENSKLPVNVILRPSARDFYYTADEFEKMLKDLEYIKNTKVSGIVVGIITPEGEINIDRMKKIMKLKGDKTVTFHKAFDQVKNFEKGIETLYSLGVNTVLTACGETIELNTENLKKIKNLNKVTVLAGGGVNEKNILKIIPAADEIHIGTAARIDGTWNSGIDIDKINKFKEIVKK